MDLQSKNFNALSSLCKRRGFVFQSAEIYGGLNACWDYGPLGVLLKKNIKDHWLHSMLKREDMTSLDSAILSHESVLKASGHVSAFVDPLSDCLECRRRFRFEEAQNSCPGCGSKKITKPRPFNLMFKTRSGALEGESSVVYLRPETAQGIYTQFLNVQKASRKKPPFGIAQIGKAFRNEITPGPFIFRTREFEQMEMQFFIPPEENKKWFDYWREERLKFYKELQFSEKNIRVHEHKKEELAHYAKMAVDIEYLFPTGWQELEGVHDRGDFDLSAHEKESGKKMRYSDEKTEFLPHVIETSSGLDRLFLALLSENLKEEKLEKETRLVLALPRHIAPIKAAFLPLSKKEPLIQQARALRDETALKYSVDYDEAGSIGKRYRRQDEIGTPFSVTIDFESLHDKKATIRDRDSMKQERIPISNVAAYLDSSIPP